MIVDISYTYGPFSIHETLTLDTLFSIHETLPLETSRGGGSSILESVDMFSPYSTRRSPTVSPKRASTFVGSRTRTDSTSSEGEQSR